MNRFSLPAGVASAITLAFAFVLAANAQTAPETSLTVIEPLQVRFVNAGSMTFLVFTTGDVEAHQLSVTPVEVKDPDGQPLSPTDALKVEYARRDVDFSGTQVTLTPKAGLFSRVGDYHASLRIEAVVGADAKAKRLQIVKAVTLSHVKPDLAINGLKDNAVALTRPAPWCDATTTNVPLTLINRMYATVNEVAITGDTITGDGGKIVAGNIEVRAKCDVTRTGSSVTPPGIDARPGPTPLTMTISGVKAAGTLQTNLLLGVKGQSTTDPIPFKLVVSDWWPVPLFTIFLGVAVAFLLNYIANRIKPVEENRFRSLQLQQLLLRYRKASADHDSEIDGLLERVHDAMVLGQAGYASDAKTKLDTLASEIDTLKKSIDTEREAALQSFRAVSALIDQLRRRAPAAAAQYTAPLESAAGFIQRNQFRYAAADLETLKSDVNAALTAHHAQELRGSRPEDGGEAEAQPLEAIINILTSKSGRAAERPIKFVIATGTVVADAEVKWEFGDGYTLAATGPNATHAYAWAGRYHITAELPDGTSAAVDIDIRPSELQSGIAAAGWHLIQLDLLQSTIALAIAVATGVWVLYTGKTFGTGAQYAEAFLWGLGIDNTVRGFGSVLKKLTSNG